MPEFKVPRVQYKIPETHTGGKVVQVRVRELDYLLVGAVSDKGCKLFHCDHLKNLLTQLGIENIPTFLDGSGYECPVKKTDEYELIGAGNCAYTSSEQHLFSGRSGSYQIEIDKSSLLSLVRFFPRGIKVIFGEDNNVEELGIGEGVAE